MARHHDAVEGGHRLRALRHARGWSQATLAHQAGSSAKTVWAAERGLGTSRATRLALLGAFGLNPAATYEVVFVRGPGERRPEFDKLVKGVTP